MRQIHFRAPNRNIPQLLGISKIAYPMKKMPAPKPKAVALSPMSALIVSFAKPTLFRSRNAMKYRNTISGNTRRFTLRIVRSPNSPSDSTDVRDPATTGSNHGRGGSTVGRGDMVMNARRPRSCEYCSQSVSRRPRRSPSKGPYGSDGATGRTSTARFQFIDQFHRARRFDVPLHEWCGGVHLFRDRWRSAVPTGARTVFVFGGGAGAGVLVRWATRIEQNRWSHYGQEGARGGSWSPPSVSVSGAGAVDRVGDVGEVGGAEFDVRRADPAVDLARAAGADDRGGDPRVGQAPRHRDGGDGAVVPVGDRPQRVDQRQVAVQLFAGELRVPGPPVVGGQGRRPLGGERTGQQPGLHRAVHDDPGVMRVAPTDLVGRGPVDQRGLQRINMTDRLGRVELSPVVVGQSNGPDLALGLQIQQHLPVLGHRFGGRWPVHLVQVDALGAQPAQRPVPDALA